MANGIAIKDVDNKLQSLEGEEVIPISTGANEPEVVEVDTLKEYINEDIDTALEGKQDVISDLDTIRSGAAAGATAYQKPGTGIPSTDLSSDVQTSLGKANTALQSFTEEDPTVSSWAKASSKPSYTASEVGAVPTTRTVNGKALSENISLTASDVNALPSNTELFSGSYNDLTDKPELFSGSYSDLTNKPTIPSSLSDLSDDSTHRVVTDTEKSTWSAKSDFSGSYNDLTDKPTIPDAQVQTDWSESDNTKVDYIKNKPTLGVGSSSGAASSSTIIGIPAGGNAGQVLYKVDGSTDYSVGWTNQTTNYPSAYCTTSGSTAAKKASCTLYAAQANSYLHVLIGSNNTSASALTLNVNLEGAKPIYINGTASSATNYTLPKGTYIVFYDGTNYYFRTDGKIQAPNGTLVSTSSTAGLLKNDGTVDTTAYTTNTGTITSVKMNGSTVASSGEADLGTVITSETSLSLGSTSGAGNAVTDISVSGHTITMTKGSTFLTSHQDISGKADKVSSPTADHLASLDSNGNLQDSGYKIAVVSSMPGSPDNNTIYFVTGS